MRPYDVALQTWDHDAPIEVVVEHFKKYNGGVRINEIGIADCARL